MVLTADKNKTTNIQTEVCGLSTTKFMHKHFSYNSQTTDLQQAVRGRNLSVRSYSKSRTNGTTISCMHQALETQTLEVDQLAERVKASKDTF